MPEPVITAMISPEKSDMAVCIRFSPGNRLKIDHVPFLCLSTCKQLFNGIIMVRFHRIVRHPMEPVTCIDLSATETAFCNPRKICPAFFQNICDKSGTVHCPISAMRTIRTHTILCCKRRSAVRRSQIISILFVRL